MRSSGASIMRPDPGEVSFARGIALGLAVASLFWGGYILTVWG
jgi:hypothetical protein